MRHLLRTVVDSFREDFGHPVSLLRVLSAYPQIHITLGEPRLCIDGASIPRWDELGTYPALDWPRRERGVLNGWKANGSHWESFTLERPEYAELGRREITSEWTCDIADIHGFTGSKSDLQAFASTDDMVEANSREMIDEVTPEKLARNLAHQEIRIIHSPGTTSDHFIQYRWDGRLWLANAGGSHHTAAAKYIAARLRVPVKLTGDLYTYSLDPTAVLKLHREFEMFVINDDDPAVACAFFDAMCKFRATWLWHAMPQPYDRTRAVLLPRSEARSMRVAAEFRQVGIADLGAFLTTLIARQLSTEPADLDRNRG